MEDHIHTNEELANILALGLDRAALSARPLLTPPVCVAELGNLRGEEQADAKDIADFAATRRGIRTAWGFVTATTGDGDDLRSLKIHLESDPWFADSFSIDKVSKQDSGIYLSDTIQVDLARAIGVDLDASSAVSAVWTDIGSVYVAGELYILDSASLSRIAATLGRAREVPIE